MNNTIQLTVEEHASMLKLIEDQKAIIEQMENMLPYEKADSYDSGFSAGYDAGYYDGYSEGQINYSEYENDE